jgi:Uri superfamily endonuclease
MKHGMEKVAKKAVRAHEERMHKGVKKYSGGGLNMERKRVGRNMAKVMNQRGR